jgi:hypothetical protein
LFCPSFSGFFVLYLVNSLSNLSLVVEVPTHSLLEPLTTSTDTMNAEPISITLKVPTIHAYLDLFGQLLDQLFKRHY